MPTVALATCPQFPDLEDDDRRLLPALAAVGVEGVPAVWSDSGVDWASFDAVVIRDTWDYVDHLPDFLAWTRAVAAVTPLANRPEVVGWNTDKTYLRDLAAAGVPVVPTAFLEPGDDPDRWRPDSLANTGDVVVKPTVSAGSRDTLRYAAQDPDGAARAHVARLLSDGRAVMVQPYLEAVDDRGETALMFFDGVYSHAIRKAALLVRDTEGTRVSGLFVQESITPREPSTAELEIAHQVIAAITPTTGAAAPLYARVDLVPDAAGDPVLLELELTEPSLFLAHDSAAASRFAAAIAASIRP